VEPPIIDPPTSRQPLFVQQLVGGAKGEGLTGWTSLVPQIIVSFQTGDCDLDMLHLSLTKITVSWYYLINVLLW